MILVLYKNPGDRYREPEWMQGIIANMPNLRIYHGVCCLFASCKGNLLTVADSKRSKNDQKWVEIDEIASIGIAHHVRNLCSSSNRRFCREIILINKIITCVIRWIDVYHFDFPEICIPQDFRLFVSLSGFKYRQGAGRI